MELEEIEYLRRRIWITEKCHMRAEKRNRFSEFYFHVTLALFALSSIFIALFQGDDYVEAFKGVLIFTSICTLSISLLIFGFSFGESAAKHRSCYLSLQRLRIENFAVVSELNEKYIETLSYHQNHSTLDYMTVAMSNIFSEKQEMKDPSGCHVHFSFFSRLIFSSSWIALRLCAIVFAVSPVVLALASIGFFGSYLDFSEVVK